MATTVLCFMIKSLSGKYSDVIALFALNRLTVEILTQCFVSALKVAMDAGYLVAVTVCDNHKVNRQFLTNYLCKGTLSASAPNPLDPSSSIFVLLDPTHTIKNVYNNFQKSDFPSPRLLVPRICTKQISCMSNNFLRWNPASHFVWPIN